VKRLKLRVTKEIWDVNKETYCTDVGFIWKYLLFIYSFKIL
jgi:hypothetical protein